MIALFVCDYYYRHIYNYYNFFCIDIVGKEKKHFEKYKLIMRIKSQY
jgi:hypothetical protein